MSGLKDEQSRARLREAADVHQRYIVRVGPDGCRSNWPEIVRSAGEAYATAVDKGGYYQNKRGRPAQLTA